MNISKISEAQDISEIICMLNLSLAHKDSRLQPLVHSNAYIPVMHSSSWVLAALDLYHDEREEQEEHGHPKTHTIHSLIAHQHIAIHMTFDSRDGRPHSSFTKAWNLQ